VGAGDQQRLWMFRMLHDPGADDSVLLTRARVHRSAPGDRHGIGRGADRHQAGVRIFVRLGLILLCLRAVWRLGAIWRWGGSIRIGGLDAFSYGSLGAHSLLLSSL